MYVLSLIELWQLLYELFSWEGCDISKVGVVVYLNFLNTFSSFLVFLNGEKCGG